MENLTTANPQPDVLFDDPAVRRTDRAGSATPAGVTERRSEEVLKLPVPSPEKSYHWNRRKLLLRNPRKLWNYILFKRSGRRPDINYLPLKLDIENVSRCNLHCVMCQVSDWPKNKRAEDMSLADFKRIIDSQHGLVEIKIQGMGEPTLQRDDYFAMIRYARKKGIWVRTTTNATLLHVNDNHRKLVEADPNEIQISMDGTTKETYEKIRRGARFERSCENMKLINAYCNERGLLKTRMWVVVQQYNSHEFVDFVRTAKELGFKRLTYALNLNDWGQDKWFETNSAVTVERKITNDTYRQAMALGAELGVDVTFWNNTLKYSSRDPKKLCPWPFERAYVASDMRIVPCCMIGNPKTADLGDAREFSKEWFGENFRKFREDHISGNIPRVCHNCYEARGANE